MEKIAVVGRASRVGRAAMTVTAAAAAILTASTLLAKPFEQLRRLAPTE
jgi:hypothetical protein